MNQRPAPSQSGFTIVELLVSTAIITLLLLVLVSITDATAKTWTFTNGRIEQFRDAREAFEAMTRRISQATLNTYWDYHYPNDDASRAPDRYIRQSDLRFICGNLDRISNSGNYPRSPTHSIFFQSPQSAVGTPNYDRLDNLLNTHGFFIEFGSDESYLPTYLKGVMAPRWRFRLMEMVEFSEGFRLYDREAAAGGNTQYKGVDWFTGPLQSLTGQTQPSSAKKWVAAENIVAMVILPRLSDQEITGLNASPGMSYSDSSLAPDYIYDSTGNNMSSLGDPNLNPVNQLPPIIQVTLVAVDEASFSRLIPPSTSAVPMPNDLFDGGSLFQSVGDTADKANPGYAQDLAQLEDNLAASKLSYRVFTSSVSVKAAKWSREQKN